MRLRAAAWGPPLPGQPTTSAAQGQEASHAQPFPTPTLTPAATRPPHRLAATASYTLKSDEPHNRPAKKLEAGHLESTPSARNIKQSLDRHSATIVMTQETSEAGLWRSALLRPDWGDVDVTMWTVLSGLKRRAKR